jgi:hypothetical protein
MRAAAPRVQMQQSAGTARAPPSCVRRSTPIIPTVHSRHLYRPALATRPMPLHLLHCDRCCRCRRSLAPTHSQDDIGLGKQELATSQTGVPAWKQCAREMMTRIHVSSILSFIWNLHHHQPQRVRANKLDIFRSHGRRTCDVRGRSPRRYQDRRPSLWHVHPHGRLRLNGDARFESVKPSIPQIQSRREL